MKRFFFAILLVFSALTIRAQDDINQYLNSHYYSFSLEKGFDSLATDTLKQKLGNYKLILLGEGGSHFLKFYEHYDSFG